MTEQTLADDVEQSLLAEPERWREEQLIERLVRDDGLTIWTDATAATEPRAVVFEKGDQSRILKAIARWRAGPISGLATPKPAHELPPGKTRHLPDATD